MRDSGVQRLGYALLKVGRWDEKSVRLGGVFSVWKMILKNIQKNILSGCDQGHSSVKGVTKKYGIFSETVCIGEHCST